MNRPVASRSSPGPCPFVCCSGSSRLLWRSPDPHRPVASSWESSGTVLIRIRCRISFVDHRVSGAAARRVPYTGLLQYRVVRQAEGSTDEPAGNCIGHRHHPSDGEEIEDQGTAQSLSRTGRCQSRAAKAVRWLPAAPVHAPTRPASARSHAASPEYICWVGRCVAGGQLNVTGRVASLWRTTISSVSAARAGR